jgi:CheY-like chemotaxis protein
VYALVVEDDSFIRDALVDALNDAGIRVACARDGAEALTLLRWGLRPVVMLVDLMMPRMTGGELLGEMRADRRLAGIPVIVVTASDQVVEGVTTLRKPLELQALLDAVLDVVRAA